MRKGATKKDIEMNGTKLKKFKDTFRDRPPVQPVQPVPSVTTRADALVVRVEHWTPKGDCTERGDKERYRNESDQKRETSL